MFDKLTLGAILISIIAISESRPVTGGEELQADKSLDYQYYYDYYFWDSLKRSTREKETHTTQKVTLTGNTGSSLLSTIISQGTTGSTTPSSWPTSQLTYPINLSTDPISTKVPTMPGVVITSSGSSQSNWFGQTWIGQLGGQVGSQVGGHIGAYVGDQIGQNVPIP